MFPYSLTLGLQVTCLNLHARSHLSIFSPLLKKKQATAQTLANRYC